MPIALSPADHLALDVLLDDILAASVSGDVSPEAARGALAHVITAAAMGGERTFRGWLRPDTVVGWKAGVALKPSASD